MWAFGETSWCRSPLGFPGPQIVKLSRVSLCPLFSLLAHLKYFVKGRVESVLLNFGLSLAALGLVGQQVHFDVAGRKDIERRV